MRRKVGEEGSREKSGMLFGELLNIKHLTRPFVDASDSTHLVSTCHAAATRLIRFICGMNKASAAFSLLCLHLSCHSTPALATCRRRRRSYHSSVPAIVSFSIILFVCFFCVCLSVFFIFSLVLFHSFFLCIFHSNK